jgi:hypothetical protein
MPELKVNQHRVNALRTRAAEGESVGREDAGSNRPDGF